MTYHIYFKNQLAGPPSATILATSEWEALAKFRSESPYPVRLDRYVATTKLR